LASLSGNYLAHIPLANYGTNFILNHLHSAAAEARGEKAPYFSPKISPILSELERSTQTVEGMFRKGVTTGSVIEGVADMIGVGAMLYLGTPYYGPKQLLATPWQGKYGSDEALMNRFWSNYAMDFRNRYPVTFALSQNTGNLDDKVKAYNHTYPDKVWYPLPPNNLIVTNKQSFYLDADDLDEYQDLITRNFLNDPDLAPYIRTKYSLNPKDVGTIDKMYKEARKNAKDYLYKRSWAVKYRDEVQSTERFNDMDTLETSENIGELLLAMADDAPADIIRKGKELIRLQEAMREVKDAFDKVKEELTPHVIEQPLELDEGVIVYVEGSEGISLSKDRLKKLLMDKLQISESVADAVIKSSSLPRYVAPYIKIVTQKPGPKPDHKSIVTEENPNEV
jgi:hypothetical protein